MTRAVRFLLAMLASMAALAAQAAFDPSYAAWDALLKKHVRYAPDGFSSRVDYAGLLRERSALRAVLADFSAVPRESFEKWPRAEREAFLINAYNAFTIEKVLTRYPDLQSIRDFGSVFGNPWKDRFFSLLGDRRTLDEVEHGMLRSPGAYDEPRVHVALVCASIGCPMLRDEAYVAPRLEAQLADALRRFLSDRTRNRYDPASKKLRVSRIFDWYGGDFERGHQGFTSVRATLARFADVLADASADREAIRQQRVEVGYLDYDWGLNDAK
jgi:hypothetical protein